jgi:hypothetical protein
MRFVRDRARPRGTTSGGASRFFRIALICGAGRLGFHSSGIFLQTGFGISAHLHLGTLIDFLTAGN